MISGEAEYAIEQLFSVAGVQRVISVDDSYANDFSVEDALGYAAELDGGALDDIFSQYPSVVGVEDFDIRKLAIKSVWEELDRPVRYRLMERLRRASKRPLPGPEASGEVVDESTVELLPEIFQKYDLVALTLEEWRKRKNDLVKKEMPPTLIMVDEDFSNEDASAEEGIKLIKELLNAEAPERVLCALLSHKYGASNIHEAWDALCRREELDKSKFVLIPKELLVHDMVAFARLVKLAILNGSSQQLKKRSAEIIRNAEHQAQDRLNAIDIYDFDQIVFRSSFREGVWEPDTLFRVFGLFHRAETRRLANEDDELRKLAADIRTISQIPTKSATAPSYNTMAVERLELYDDADYLNAHFMPIDLGDIFQKTGDSSKRFILLGQSCDLMVRSDGKRGAFSHEALLAEIVKGPPNDLSSHGELKFLDPNDRTEYFVSFKRTHTVKLFVLDLCVFNASGEAVFTVDEPCPDRVVPAWKKRHGDVNKEVSKILGRVNDLNKKRVDVHAAAALVARCSNEGLFTAKIDVNNRTLAYNVKRVARLLHPRASALLTRYANFVARQAFDHQFGERDQDSNETGAPVGGPVSNFGDTASAPPQADVRPATPAVDVREDLDIRVEVNRSVVVIPDEQIAAGPAQNDMTAKPEPTEAQKPTTDRNDQQ